MCNLPVQRGFVELRNPCLHGPPPAFTCIQVIYLTLKVCRFLQCLKKGFKRVILLARWWSAALFLLCAWPRQRSWQGQQCIELGILSRLHISWLFVSTLMRF